MNNATDDKELNQYLNRDSDFSRHYKNVYANEVPTELDNLVIAQATQNISEKSLANRWRQWSAPVAMAATLIATLSIVIRINMRHDAPTPMGVTPSVESVSRSETVTAKESDAKPNVLSDGQKIVNGDKLAAQRNIPESTAATSVSNGQVEQEARATIATSQKIKRVASPQAPQDAMTTNRLAEALASSPAAAPPVAQPAVPDEHRIARLQQGNVGNPYQQDRARSEVTKSEVLEEPVVTSRYLSAQRSNADAALAKEAREANPEQWLNYIRELRVRQNTAVAESEWRRFQKAYPTFSVASDDVARGEK